MNPFADARVLVVDDEPEIRQVLLAILTERGLQARDASDGERALEMMKTWTPELIITDLSMPRMGGIALCREVRRHSLVPIIVLSVRNEEALKVEALETGADDYITKPFGTDELLARVKAALRRAATNPSVRPFEIGSFRLDHDERRVEVQGQGQIPLTRKEFELLAFLMKNPGKVVTQEMLQRAVWGRNQADQSDSVRALVRQLRKKIEPSPESPRYLKTEPWIGYRFEPGE
jgi:two-component system, OmpR family, KDP operon response regulator KdpE